MSETGTYLSGKGSNDENFPVASWLIAPRHRAVVLAFYRFARAADDAADHPSLAPEAKYAFLDRLEATLLGRSDADPEALPLRKALADARLAPRHPLDLLTAFRQDVDKRRYANFAELMRYCRYSAAPVGRFVLDAHGESEALWPGNDALCAALQIINHLQDCGKDYRDIDRVYIPLDMLAEEGLGVDALTGKASSPGLTRCLARLVKSCDELLDQSEGFAGAIVDARLGCEVAAIQRLARRLCAILATSDPLRDKVHLSKFQALATAGAAVAGEGLARLGGSRRRAVRNADAA